MNEGWDNLSNFSVENWQATLEQLSPWQLGWLFLAIGVVLGGILVYVITRLRWQAKLALRQQQQDRLQLQFDHLKENLEASQDHNQSLSQQKQDQDEMLIQRGETIARLESEIFHRQAQEEQIEQLQDKIDQLQGELRTQHGIGSDLKARLEAANKETEEKVALLQNAKEQMKLEFQQLAAQLLEEKSEKFTLQNKSNLGEILNPLREQLGDFKKKVEDVYDRESRDRVSLLQELSSLKQLNAKMSEDAINLTRALKGEAKAQGNWGEMVLERLLEASGLSKGREYQTQGSFTNEAGQQQRPDVIVQLPDNKQIIIDSKVSLTAWERYSSEQDEDQAKYHLKAHIDSLKSHIRDLSAKNYDALYEINTPEFVLLFVPIEPAFLKALEVDNDLFSDALARNIMLVCPSTLLVTLKTVHSIWRFEYQNRNAIEIATQAGQLHDQFVLFVESLDDVGDKLDKAQAAFDKSRRRLVSGRGNLVRRVHQLETLGAKAKKSLNGALLEQALDDDQPASQSVESTQQQPNLETMLEERD